MPTLKIGFALFACALLSLLAPGCQERASSGKPLVVSSIFAYYDAARALAGDKCDVEIILPPDTSPHDYQPTLPNKALVTKAQLFIMNGLGIDDRFADLLSDSKAKKLVIGDIVPHDQLLKSDEISLGGPNAEKTDDAGMGNPHIWLDPLVQMKAADAIHDALVQIDPADKATFDANLKRYQDDLHALDTDFAEAVKTFKTKDFIGFHSAYNYLAHRYGLHQVASIEEIPDAGLSLEQIQRVEQLIKDKNIHYIAVETALGAQATVDKIKNEAHVQTITLQPLETYDNPNDTYVSLMKQNLAALKTALGG
jgi:zinc transport system substrate-binding protein